MKRMILVLAMLVGSMSQAATKQLYVKDGNQFKPVTKREATITLLKGPRGGEIYACVEQRLSEKMTIKAKASDD